jgi:hypothetical protein
MADYTGGYSGAVNDASNRDSQAAYRQLAMQRAAQEQFMMMQAQQQQQRQMAARAGAGQALYGMMGQQPPTGLPPPPPGTPQGGPMPPAPGQSSQPPAPVQAAPVLPPGGAGGASMQAGGGGGQAAPQIPPFRPMPSAPPQQGPAPGGGVPPPPAPAAAAPAGGEVPQRAFDLKSMIQGLKASGVPPDKVMDMLDELTPVMNAQNKQELDMFRAQTQAQGAAIRAYEASIHAYRAERDLDIKRDAETRRAQDSESRRTLNAQKVETLKAKLHGGVGGAANLKTTELIYPKGADGRPDETQAPIGVRGITKTGRIVTLDADGKPAKASEISGGTAKEAKDTKGSAAQNVRTGIVKAGVTNALARLDEIEKKHPGGTTSSFFGTHADNPVTRAAYGAGQAMQSSAQQDIDAKWASFIDEAIPVFTGGLRGSDAFRRFLIEQAPGPGAKPETIKEKMRLFRQNIEGTNKAFFNKFASDPAMHAPGTKPEDIEAAKGSTGNTGGGPKVGEKRTINGTPAHWDGKGWLPDG